MFSRAIRKSDAAQQRTIDDFWQRERLANTVRKKDISNLNYINIPLEKFPLNLATDAEETLKELSCKKILNLTGMSNTDLKMEYGVANLEELSEYDNNFTRLVRALDTYAEELLAAGMRADAQNVLVYAVSIGCDSLHIYTMLASLYAEEHNTTGLSELQEAAQKLPPLSQKSVLAMLDRTHS
jgi:hypothetical protein